MVRRDPHLVDQAEPARRAGGEDELRAAKHQHLRQITSENGGRKLAERGGRDNGWRFFTLPLVGRVASIRAANDGGVGVVVRDEAVCRQTPTPTPTAFGGRPSPQGGG